jgi:hypothetical protein
LIVVVNAPMCAAVPSARRWEETSCVSLRLQPAPGTVEVFEVLASVFCQDHFEALHEFGARSIVDLEFVETEDLADLGFTTSQQARFIAAMAKRSLGGSTHDGGCAPAPVPVAGFNLSTALAPTNVVSVFLERIGLHSFHASFEQLGATSLADLPYLEPDDLCRLGLTPVQQRDFGMAVSMLLRDGGSSPGTPMDEPMIQMGAWTNPRIEEGVPPEASGMGNIRGDRDGGLSGQHAPEPEPHHDLADAAPNRSQTR